MLFLEQTKGIFFILRKPKLLSDRPRYFEVLGNLSWIIDQIATHLMAHTLTHPPTSGIYSGRETPFSSYIGSQKIQLEFKHHKGKKLLSTGCPIHQLCRGASLRCSTHRFLLSALRHLVFCVVHLPTPTLCFFSIFLAPGLLTAANTGNNGPQSWGG